MCIAHVRMTSHWGIPWLSTVTMIFDCLQTSNSINRKCCIKTCEYFILTIKENCQMDNYGKFWKKICSYRIMVLFHWWFELGKLCPGVGILFRFSDPGTRVLHWKAVPGAGILTEKISGPAVSPGGGGDNRSKLILALDFKGADALK